MNDVMPYSTTGITLQQVHMCVCVMCPQRRHKPTRVSHIHRVGSKVVGGHILTGCPAFNISPRDSPYDVIFKPVARCHQRKVSIAHACLASGPSHVTMPNFTSVAAV